MLALLYSCHTPHTYCFGLLQLFLLVSWSCSDSPRKRVLYSYPLGQVVPRVLSQFVDPLLLLLLPSGVCSNCSCWKVVPAQIGRKKESCFLAPMSSRSQCTVSVVSPPLIPAPPPLPALVSSVCHCWLVGSAQIVPKKESFVLAP